MATRADVGLRTVFRHFEDMEGLYREISARTLAEIAPLLATPPPRGTLAERISASIANRAAVFEVIMPSKVAGGVQRHRAGSLREDHAKLVKLQRAGLRSAIPRVVMTDRTTFGCLELLLSFEAWRRLRVEQALSVAEARRVVERGAFALLGLDRA